MTTLPRPSQPRKGVWMFPAAPAGQLVDAVTRAEQLGLDEVWIADEGIAREPMAVLAGAARETSSIRLGVGITSPLLRHPGAIAATAATIDELSGGRFTLGLGVGGQMSLGPFGLSTDRPVAVLRDAIVMARAVLAAKATKGYEPDGHALGPRNVPIWVGTRGPQMVRMAARLADGIFLSGCTPAQHESIAAAMHDVDTSAQMALYQSASDVVDSPSVSDWDSTAAFLAAEADQWRPAAVGINLDESALLFEEPTPALLFLGEPFGSLLGRDVKCEELDHHSQVSFHRSACLFNGAAVDTRSLGLYWDRRPGSLGQP